MTPLQLANAECCNLVDSKCVHRGADCLLAQRLRCDYFETHVLPLGDKPALRNYKAYHEATERYREMFVMLSTDKGVRRCQCGQPLPKHKRLCPDCSATNQREAKRQAAQKRRLGTSAM